MDHLAILKKDFDLLHKIITGEKTIESRWYKTKKVPFNRIKEGDIVYFKESGEPVKAKAYVQKVIQYDDLTDAKIFDLLRKYEKELSIIADEYIKNVRNKKYGILIFLDKVERINPFKIDKTGYGNQVSWITVKDIQNIKKFDM